MTLCLQRFALRASCVALICLTSALVAAQEPSDKRTFDERLQAKVTFEYEGGVDRLRDQFVVRTGINLEYSHYLQYIGVTKWGRYSIAVRDQGVEDLLLQIVQDMNPQRDVHDPASKEMQVVYVVAGQGKEQKMVIVPRGYAWKVGTPADIFKVAKPEPDE